MKLIKLIDIGGYVDYINPNYITKVFQLSVSESQKHGTHLDVDDKYWRVKLTGGDSVNIETLEQIEYLL